MPRPKRFVEALDPEHKLLRSEFDKPGAKIGFEVNIRRPSEHAQASAVPIPDEDAIVDPAPDPVPPDWQLGALLNVRNAGAYYIVTLFPEEFDRRHPERALRFQNSARCQDFVSQWYARVWRDPRA